MPIISSSIVEDSAQVDGRRWVREQHIDQLGIKYYRVYMAEVGQIVDLIVGAEIVLVQLIADELAANEVEILNADF